jgi:5-methyltetrahydropteroyltriglutamate--homocysteine methyltransferase
VNALRPAVQRGIVDVIRRQAGAGVDVISDGEVGKFGFGSLTYYGRRLSGLTTRPLKPGEAPFMALETNERIEFAEFYKDLQFLPAPSERVVCSGAVTYIGQQEIQTDIQLFKSALAEANVRAEDAFMCVLAPGWLEHFFYNEHYRPMKSTCSLWPTRSSTNTKPSWTPDSFFRSMTPPCRTPTT